MQSISSDTSISLNKLFLQQLTNDHSPRIEFVNVTSIATPPGARKSRSAVWSKFDRVVLDGNLIQFVCCKNCRSILGHKSRGGTSGLRLHKCHPHSQTVSDQLGGAASPASGSAPSESGRNAVAEDLEQSADEHFAELVKSVICQTRISTKSKEEIQHLEFATKLKDDTIKFMAKDLQSYEILQGEGFQNLAQTFVGIGAQYGNIDVTNILPKPADISRNLQLVAQEIRLRMAGEFQECEHVAISTDFWTNHCAGCYFVTLSAHYFVEDGCNLNLRTRVLDTRKVGVSQSGDVAWQAVLAVLEQYKLDVANVTIVTDNAELRTAAFKSVATLSSVVGNLNEVVVSSLQATVKENEQLASLIGEVDELLDHIQELRIHHSLKLTIEDCCTNHWTNIFAKFTFVKRNFDKLMEELETKDDAHLLAAIDLELLEALLNFMSLFKESLELLCADMEPTLHFAVPWLHQLKTWCKPNDEDCATLSALRATTLKSLETVMKVGDWHEVATIFNPRMKGLTFLPAQSRSAAYESLRRLVGAVQVIEEKSCEPVEKKACHTVLDSLCDVVDDSNCADEVDLYLRHKVTTIESVTSFWELHRSQYPNLFKVMKQVLCIPAWCSAMDREFQPAVSDLCRKRLSLAQDIVDDVLILQGISDYL